MHCRLVGAAQGHASVTVAASAEALCSTRSSCTARSPAAANAWYMLRKARASPTMSALLPCASDALLPPCQPLLAICWHAPHSLSSCPVLLGKPRQDQSTSDRSTLQYIPFSLGYSVTAEQCQQWIGHTAVYWVQCEEAQQARAQLCQLGVVGRPPRLHLCIGRRHATGCAGAWLCNRWQLLLRIRYQST